MLFLTNINLNKNELQNAVIQNLSSDPSSPKSGQLYFNTTTHNLKQYNGTSWEVVGKEITPATYSALGGVIVDSSTLTVDASGNLAVKVPTDNNYTDTDATKLAGIDAGAEVNVIETINVNGTALTPSQKAVNIYTIASAAFADDSTATVASPVKMTLTDGNSDTITANIPKVSSSSAGVAPKGASVSTQSQTTKFLREDGTWAAPSYTNGSDYVKKDGTTVMTGALNMNSHKVTSVTDPTSAQDAATKNYVDNAISDLAGGMVFKGSVGSSGTIEWSALPTAGSANKGYTYKVITAHATAPICEVGDVIVSDGSAWVVIPSGDEPSGTVTSVATGFGLSGGPITSSGTISLATAYGDTVNPYGSKTANYVLAAPNGSAGTPSFRALVAADIPDLSGTYQAKGNYKTTQTAKADPSAGSTGALQFIATITQNTNGEITATKEPVLYDNSPTEDSTNLVTSGGVYAAIQQVSGGAVTKKTVSNPALTASGGAWTWSISSSDALATGAVSVDVYNSSGEKVMPEITVNQSTGAITIVINDTLGASTLAANTYKAVIMG